MIKYIHVEEEKKRNIIIENVNTYLIPPQTYGGSTTLNLER
jgi:hypothetical protein